MPRQIPMSDGVEQRFEHFSEKRDKAYAALCGRGKAQQFGFETAMDGEYIPRDHAYPQSNGNVYDIDPKTGRAHPVPVPHPQYEERHDLRPNAGIKPRPY